MTPQEAQNHGVEVMAFNRGIKSLADNHILTVNARKMNYWLIISGSAEDEPGLSLVSEPPLSRYPHPGLNKRVFNAIEFR
jgi:hypothetical protein